MFDRIVPHYDLMNRLMTVGLDRRWRAAAAAAAAPPPGDRVLDACCGTGDLALALARRVPGCAGDGSRLLAGDARARARQRPARARRARRARVRPRRPAGAAVRRRRPSAPSRSGWGVRNVRRPAARLRRDGARGRARRARSCASRRRSRPARPGGASTPSGSSAWCRRMGALVTGDAEAYAYLPASVRSFPDAEGLAAVMRARRPARRALPAVRLRRHGAARRRGAGVKPRRRPVVALGRPAPPRAPTGLAAVEERLSRVVVAVPRPRSARPAASTLSRRRQAPAPAARAALRRATPARSTGRCCAPPPRSSCSTWRRSCTTTCSTAPTCGAAGPPWPAPTATRWPSRPATSCWRRRSRSSPAPATRPPSRRSPRSPGASPRARCCRPTTPSASRSRSTTTCGAAA